MKRLEYQEETVERLNFLNPEDIYISTNQQYVDIVKEQIKIAAGEKLSFTQKDIKITGHAIECRVNAEDPVTFMPCPGLVKLFHPPGGPGIRVDSHLYSSYKVPPYYDSLIAKIIAYSNTRRGAIARMANAFDEIIIDGIKTNIPLHQDILQDSNFKQGGFNIHYLEQKLEKQNK